MAIFNASSTFRRAEIDCFSTPDSLRSLSFFTSGKQIFSRPLMLFLISLFLKYFYINIVKLNDQAADSREEVRFG